MELNEKLAKLIGINNGHFTTSEAINHGVSKKQLKQLMDDEIIEKIGYGLYIDSQYFPDPFTLIQHRAPKSVFSHLTALYLHDLSDRDPIEYMITIPSTSRTRLADQSNVQVYYNNDNLINLGVVTLETPSGTKVKAFDIERTLCDCIKYMNQLDKDLVLTGLKRYLKSPYRNNVKMLEYGKQLNISQQILRYLEVL